MKNIGIFFNGRTEWYQNVFKSFTEHERTWMQQSKIPKEEYLKMLKQILSEQGFIYGFGYVQSKVCKVIWRMKITKIITSHSRIPAPDEAVPKFEQYDIDQGGCKLGDFSYPMWLHIESMERILPIEKSSFININNNKRIQGVRGIPNYIIEIPIELVENRSDTLSEKPKNKEVKIAQENEPTVIEGNSVLAQHMRYERNIAFIQKIKQKAMTENKMLNCQVCGFSFFEKYGEVGEGFIEAHHANPLFERNGKTITRREDIILVCSNCHRMLHRGNPIYSIVDLKQRINKSAIYKRLI